jgi:hypothetical protein
VDVRSSGAQLVGARQDRSRHPSQAADRGRVVAGVERPCCHLVRRDLDVGPVAGALGLLWFIASFAIALGVVLIMLGIKIRRAFADLTRAKMVSVQA